MQAITQHSPHSPDVFEYFSLTPPTASPASLQRYRLAACDHPHYDYALVKRVAVLWTSPDVERLGYCLWCNMSPSQLAFIVLLSRLFRVTHILECGRMGGLPVFHYAHFGLNVTSFELTPLPWVKSALAALAPSVQQIDGDCIEGIPRRIKEITRAEPMARIGIVFDGPKGRGVIALANRLAEEAAFIAIDDQSPNTDPHDQPRWPYVYEGSPQWNSWLPTESMNAALNAGEAASSTTPSGINKANVNISKPQGRTRKPHPKTFPYHHTGAIVHQMVMLGGRWRWD